MLRRIVAASVLLPMAASSLVLGGVLVDTSAGLGPPPTSLGGYMMDGFPPDVRPTGTPVSDVAAAPVTGNVLFSVPVTHYVVGTNPGEWNGWSHGYLGDVYHANWTGAGGSTFAQIDLTLPANTLAFALYLEPEVGAATWDFNLLCTSANSLVGSLTGLSISGGGATYVGFYSNDPTDPLTSLHIEQTTEQFLGFGIGEWTINVVPEPGAFALITASLLLGTALTGRSRIAAKFLKRYTKPD